MITKNPEHKVNCSGFFLASLLNGELRGFPLHFLCVFSGTSQFVFELIVVSLHAI